MKNYPTNLTTHLFNSIRIRLVERLSGASKFQKIKKKIFSSFLLRAAVLVSLKEFYLFLRNLYGLVVHPFKTIVEIRKKPDWSQTVLVFGLPVYGGIGLMGGMGIALVLLLFFNPTNELLINFVFFLLSCLVLLVSCYALYLGFWVGKYFVTRKVSH